MCQGQALLKAEVSLSNLLVPGQTYVVLSCVNTLEGLRVLPGFHTHTTVNEDFQQFYKEQVTAVTDVIC